MGGDVTAGLAGSKLVSLNPPRPHGRGLDMGEHADIKDSLNPPRPHGRGLILLRRITQSGGLKSPPPAWAGTARRMAGWP